MHDSGSSTQATTAAVCVCRLSLMTEADAAAIALFARPCSAALLSEPLVCRALPSSLLLLMFWALTVTASTLMTVQDMDQLRHDSSEQLKS